MNGAKHRVDQLIKGVEVFSWNPRRALIGGRLARWTSVGPRQNNFGDLLGPLIVRLMVDRCRLTAAGSARDGQRLLSVGSVVHFARTGDTLWGAGVNGKVAADYAFERLDVRAVRGPRTAQFLRARGISVPDVFGDPALLLPDLMPELPAAAEHKSADVVVVPNLNDVKRYASTGNHRILDPRSDLTQVLRQIASAKFVTGSSLHAIIVAESLGIPARLVAPATEAPFKYLDYYEGTGRAGYTAADTVDAAVRMGGEPPLAWSREPLLASFPGDLWRN
jgi:pyruvyltransferase